MTRTEIQNRLAQTIATTTGFAVEVTVAESESRGLFVSLFGPVDALDAARGLMENVMNVRFTDRDIDPDDSEQCDFYSII